MAVRREKVLLEVEDNATNPLLRAAAAAKTLDKALNDVDGTKVGSRDIDRLGSPNGSLAKAAVQSRRLGSEIDRTSGRVRLLVDAAVLLGPALIPIGALAVPALTGLAAQAGAAALGVGTMVVAFQGVGDTLTAVNDAALEPTADNLEAARLAMEALSPQARELVTQIQEMRPAFTALRDAAAAGLFPGLVDALDDMEQVFPNLERILFRVGEAAGGLGAELGEALSGPRGREFLSFIEAEVPNALIDLGRIAGNLAAGMGELWRAFTPLNNDFADWMLSASRSFDRWAQGLSQTEGFENFVAYIRENGPRVADAMGAIGNAVLQIVQAAAPLGGPALAALEAVADVIAAIANSPAGPALLALATGMTLVSRSAKTLEALRGSALFAGIGRDADGAARSMTKMQRASVAAGGALAGLSLGAAAIRSIQEATDEALPGVEELVQTLLNVNSTPLGTFGDIENSIKRILDPGALTGFSDTLQTPFEGLFGEASSLRQARAEVERLDAAMAGLVASAGPERATQTFKDFAANAQMSEEETRQLLTIMPQYRDALAGAANQAQIAGRAGGEAGAEAAEGFDRATGAAQRFKNAVTAATRALERRSSARDYQQALDDLTKSIRQNGRTMDITSQKGRDNSAAFDQVASSALAAAKNLRGTDRIKVLTAARGDLVDAGRKLGMTRAEAAALADRLLGLDKIRANPKVDADISGAMNAIGQVQYKLQSLNGQTATTYVNTVYTASGKRFKDVPAGMDSGGTVAGPRYPYRDRVLTMLAPGEEVISNRYGQADRNRELLKAINANRYANGGTVGASVTVSAPNVSMGLSGARLVLEGPGFEPMVARVVEARFSDHNAAQSSRARAATYREANLD